jgi:hypothetical protein
MTSLPFVRAMIGILGSALLATSLVAAAAGPAFTAPIAAIQTV